MLSAARNDGNVVSEKLPETAQCEAQSCEEPPLSCFLIYALYKKMSIKPKRCLQNSATGVILYKVLDFP